MLKCATLAVTTSYQSIATILAAQTNKPFGGGLSLTDGVVRNTGLVNVRLSSGNTYANEGNDDVSITLEPGDVISFSSLNLAGTFVKAASGTGSLDFYGDAQ